MDADLKLHDALWPLGYGVFTEVEYLTRQGFPQELAERIVREGLDADAEFVKLYPPGSKAEHDLVGCAPLYQERCFHCQPLQLEELPAVVIDAVFDTALALADDYLGRASRALSDTQAKVARMRHPMPDDEIPF